MLGETAIYPTIAVKDLNLAKQFYTGKLGLAVEDDKPYGVTYKSGGGKLFVYPSSSAGTNQATYASWTVGDIDAVVADLKANNIVFEHYDDLPETTRDGDVHTMGELKAVWFKDPDGNILSVSNM